MTWTIVVYLFLIFFYRLGHFYAIIVAKNLYKPHHLSDKGLAMVWIPLFLVLIGAPYDYYYLKQEPGLFLNLMGASLIIIASLIRAKGLTDSSLEYKYFVDKQEQHQLITRGIYSYVRYPLYLANILLMIGCTIYLKSVMAAAFSLIGIIGIIIKISLEDKLLAEKNSGFHQYSAKTAKLIPGLY